MFLLYVLEFIAVALLGVWLIFRFYLWLQKCVLLDESLNYYEKSESFRLLFNVMSVLCFIWVVASLIGVWYVG